MLDGVLPQTEKVRARDRVTMLPVSNMIRRAHDDRPGTSGCACNDGLIRHVICNDLEFGSITPIMDGAIVNCLRIRITRREIAPKKVPSVKAYEECSCQNRSPIDGIAHRKDVTLGMEVLPHTNLT